MCSIIGYRGKSSAAPILVNGLQRMEYRGYDSVGIATKSKNQILLRKGVGKVVEVNNAIQLDGLPGNIGIGHTRWATHGKVTENNVVTIPSYIVKTEEEAKIRLIPESRFNETLSKPKSDLGTSETENLESEINNQDKNEESTVKQDVPKESTE